MKKSYSLLFLIGIALSFSFVLKNDVKVKGPIDGDCMCKGKKLYGKVQFVSSFPDVKVQIVTSFPDLKVKKVSSFADDCGEWEVVESFPDVKVQIVESFPDVKVQYVESFPGME